MKMKHLEKRQGFSEPRCPVLVEATFRSPSCGSLKAAATRGRGSLKAYEKRTNLIILTAAPIHSIIAFTSLRVLRGYLLITAGII